jgi:hypothetical protein
MAEKDQLEAELNKERLLEETLRSVEHQQQ